MVVKRRILTLLLVGLALLTLVYLALSFLPFNLLPIQQKPIPQKIYDYYEVVDESSGESLMAVPLIVNVGDELLTEENKRYEVVKVIENTAYARRIKDGNASR